MPLEQVVGWLVSLAPNGMIEVGPKWDPTVQPAAAQKSYAV
jgi:hypothetical protein